MPSEDFLNERTRAEDIILGSLGLGEDAKLITIELTGAGFRGIAKFSDGEELQFENDCEVSDLERWALGVLKKKL